MTIIGLISDTHGLLRAEAMAALKDVPRILHAGDAGKPEVLQSLRAIAPVTCVRGNVDIGEWALALPLECTVTVEGWTIHMLHDLNQLSMDCAAGNVAVVISGHTHRPLVERRDGVLFINPGSAGPRRFSLPVSVGFLRLSREAPPEAWIETLNV
jgi:uncharacterized protein